MREAFVHHVAGLYPVPGTLPRAGEMDVNIPGLCPRRSSQAGWRRDHSKSGETLWLKGVLLQWPASTLTDRGTSFSLQDGEGRRPGGGDLWLQRNAVGY